MIAFILLQTVEKGMTFEKVWNNLLDKGTDLGLTLIKAAVVFIVGRFVVNLLNKLVRRLMERRNVELSVKTFVMSLVNILLMILLIVIVTTMFLLLSLKTRKNILDLIRMFQDII